jgi:uncharacterized protein involved in response to NO
MSTPAAAEARSRWRVAACLATVIGLGLLSRRYPLPGVLAEHTGDALYTVAVFAALAWCRPAWPGARLAAVAFLVSAAVEFAQLLSWPWLVELRRSTLGALLLGQGFQGADFVAYAIGAVGAWSLDGLAGRRR